MKLTLLFLSSLLYLLLPVRGIAQAGKGASGTPVSRQDTATRAPVIIPTITGTVVDESGKPLAGVTVSLVGVPAESSITNSAGGFLLRSTLPSPVLRVHYAGYEQQEVATKESEPVSIQLNKLPNYERQRKQRAKAADKAYRKS